MLGCHKVLCNFEPFFYVVAYEIEGSLSLYRCRSQALTASMLYCGKAASRRGLLVNLPLPFATRDLEAVKMSMHVSTEWCRLDHALCSKLILKASHLQT